MSVKAYNPIEIEVAYRMSDIEKLRIKSNINNF